MLLPVLLLCLLLLLLGPSPGCLLRTWDPEPRHEVQFERGERSTIFAMDEGAGKSCNGTNYSCRTLGTSNPWTGNQKQGNTAATRRAMCCTMGNPNRLAFGPAAAPSVPQWHHSV